MSINLEKRAEQVKIILEKRNITKIPAVRVGMAVDTSGSIRDMFNDGSMQKTVDRLLAVAMKFDDNGELDMWHFNSVFSQLPQATKEDYETYVKNKILNNGSVRLWGGTTYGDVINDVVKYYFGSSTKPAEKTGLLGGLFGKKAAAPVVNSAAGIPAMCFFLTDGACQDQAAARAALREAKQHNVYWNLIGVGDPSEFRLLQEMADELPNVGFLNLKSLSMTDEQIYEALISEEFCTWIKKF